MITEGKFLKRFIPESKRQHYDSEKLNQKVEIKNRFQFYKYSAFVLTFLISTSAIGLYIYKHSDKFLEKIDLTEKELSELTANEYKWNKSTEQFIPLLYKEFMGDKRIVLLTPNPDNEKSIETQKVMSDSLDLWKKFLKKNELRYKECNMGGAKYCLKYNKNKIFIVLPGPWDQELLETSIAEGAHILLFGPPSSIVSKEKEDFKLFDLNFEQFVTAEDKFISIVGDQPLTLGFDAGQIIKSRPIFQNLKVTSKASQAMSIPNYNMAYSSSDTRLYSKVIDQGRLVWLDTPPEFPESQQIKEYQNIDQLYGNVFKFLSGFSHSSIAMWPSGKKYAATFSQDTEDQYENSDKLIEELQYSKIPFTWFIISDVAQKHRSLTKEMMKTGEIACHGDNHEKFSGLVLKEQVERIARCKKVLKELTDRDVQGFRPPYEEFDSNTMSAMPNTSNNYIFTETAPETMVPKVLISSGENKKTLISINRSISDDFEMWATRKLDLRRSKMLFEKELNWIKKVGGSYNLNFHTQNIGKEENFDLVIHAIRTLKNDPEISLSTVGELALWWNTRHQLLLGKVIPDQLIEKFKPVVITLKNDGTLERTAVKVAEMENVIR